MSDNNAITTTNNNKATPADSVTVNRSITILRKEGGSAYYRRNAKFIPEGKIKIGSSINSIVRLKSNMAELNAYMPSILGCSVNDPKYSERLDLWFNNISKLVPETGLNLEVGFIYNDKVAMNSIIEVEKRILATFTKAKKVNSKDRDLAFKVRDASIIELERTKYKYGFPINVSDYMLWRYCLEYGDIANDIALINKTGGIRFYIYDPAQEAYKEKIEFDIRKEASIIYVKLLDLPSKVEQILWVYLSANTDVAGMSEIDKFKSIETLSKVNPSTFIRLYKDVSIGIKADIERMIHYNILKRLDNTNVIVDEYNDVIGNDMSQAIVFFKNVERNKARITALTSKLKNYTND